MTDDGAPAEEAADIAAEAVAKIDEAFGEVMGEPPPPPTTPPAAAPAATAATAAPPPAADAASAAVPKRVEPPPSGAVDLLSQIQIFAGLQPAYVRRIAAVGAREHHDLDAVIFAEGAVGDKMYLILNGAVRISRQVPGMGEEALAVLRAGNYFGEMSLVDDAPRSADARAHEATDLFVIRKDDLEDLLFVDRDLAYDLLWNFVRTLSGRLRETNDKMTFLSVTNRF